MPKLYYTPTSCGASSFICAYIAELKYDCEVVDLATHTTENGVDFYTINPKGNVPALVLDDGTVLNENMSCLEYIADQSHKVELAPPLNSVERYEFRQILSFLASELHPTIGMFFNPRSKDQYIREFLVQTLDRKMKYLQKNILNMNKTFVYGNYFSIVDAYLHIILSWFGYVGLDLSNYPVAYIYLERISNLDLIKNAKKRMSTIPSTIY